MEQTKPVKDRARSEREKLRELTFKGKLEYIWNYYNYYIIGTVVGIAVIVSIVTTCANRAEIGLFIEWSAPFIEQEDFDTLINTLQERLFPDVENIEVQGSINYIISDDRTYMVQYEQKIAAMIVVGGIDIFVLDKEAMGQYSGIGYLLPLENMLAEIEATNPAAYECISGELALAQYQISEDTFTEQIMGVRINNSHMLGSLTYPLPADVFFCVAITANNYENVKQTLIMLFE